MNAVGSEREFARISVLKPLRPEDRGRIAVPDVPLRRVHRRHYLLRFTWSSRARARTTYILPEMEEIVERDRLAINAGLAEWDQGAGRWTIQGRVYGDEGTGTFYPISGDGFVTVNHTVNAIRNRLQRHGGMTREALQIISYMTNVDDDDLGLALKLWRLREERHGMGSDLS